MKPNSCFMPQPIPNEDKQALEKIRKILVDGYCGQKQAEYYENAKSKVHKCMGRIIFDHISVTMQCPLCGDEKKLL